MPRESSLQIHYQANHAPPNSHKVPSIAIIGGGIAGLMAARSLLTAAASEDHCQSNAALVRVTVLERNDYWGGRIRKAAAIASDTSTKQHVLELGAELVHGGGTPLTELIAEVFPDDMLEDIFIVSHADGGPSPRPTAATGEHGVYYMNGETYHFADERLRPLQKALDGIELGDSCSMDPTVSVGEYLSSTLGDEALRKLAVASFGNTVGCTDLSQISLSMWAKFEAWWEEHEEEGDFCFPRGMHSLVDHLVKELESHPSHKLVLQRETAVLKISATPVGKLQLALRPRQDDPSCAETTTTSVFDAVIVTAPPHLWPQLLPDIMTSAKHEALQFVGTEIATKVIVAFRQRVWPDNISCLVSADHLIPEMWFRELEPNKLYAAVGFLTSKAAKSFLTAIDGSQADSATEGFQDTDERSNRKATEIVVDQLAEIFGTPKENALGQAIISETRVFTWEDGGYMYPRVGMQPHHSDALATPIMNVFFAGEATHTGACMTVQAAMSSGTRAAKEVLASLTPRYR